MEDGRDARQVLVYSNRSIIIIASRTLESPCPSQEHRYLVRMRKAVLHEEVWQMPVPDWSKRTFCVSRTRQMVPIIDEFYEVRE